MCGIAGIIGTSLNELKTQQILASLAHRGPDAKGWYSEEKISLLHTRLSIQDISEQAQQPMFSRDERYCIVFNGEIYNHLEIRKILEGNGHQFRSHSDTETLLYGYMQWGANILEKLNGIFAFAIYDLEKKRLFAARDAFGVKPLYYHAEGGLFAFASEIKTILSLSNFKKEINPNALFQTLLLQWQLGTNTGFKQIHKLLPGHCLSIDIHDAENFKIKKWKRESFDGQYEYHSEEEWILKLDKALNNAVQRQLLSDKSIAYFLSGGLDSSLLLAIAKKLAPEQKLKAYTINTGMGWNKEGFSEDLPFAQMVAKHVQVDLEIIDTSIHFLEEFDAMIYHLEEAQADIAPLLVQQISRKAKSQGYDVLIGGVAGDDIFSGYRRHQAIAYEKSIDKIPLSLRKILKKTGCLLPEKKQFRRIKKIMAHIDQNAMQRMFSYFFWSDKETIQSLFAKDFLLTVDKESIEKNFQQIRSSIPNENNPLNQLLHLEMNSFLPCHNLNYTDKMGMAESVEIRVPYLDNELVELASKIPPELKMKGITTKYLLKKVAEKYLPKEIIYRQKTGFGAPIRTWMQEDKAFQKAVLDRLQRLVLNNAPIFNAQKIEELYQDTLHKKRDNSYTLLSLLAIESWLRQFATTN
jgi:asparagine synthase (glutamine-hydrolysing)